VSRSSAAQPGAIVLGSDFKALGVVRSLGQRGIPCVVVDDLPRSAWFSRHVIRRVRWRSAMWGPAFLDFLIELGTVEGFRDWVLLPMQDEVVELVARNRQALAGIFRLVTQDWQIIRWAQDKRLVYQVAQELGIPYPRTWYPANADALARMELPYPVIVKPAMSIQLQYATGRKAFPARNQAELLEQYDRATSIMDADALMVQDHIPGDGETQLSVGAFCRDGRLLNGMTVRRRRQYPFDYGLSSTFVEAIEIPGLYETAERLVRRMRLSGPVEVEFKRDLRDGVDKLLDVNVRLWGWHGLCRACGLDFAYMQYREALGEPPGPASPVYGRHWRRLVTDVPAALQEMRHGTLSPRAYLGSLGGQTVPAVFDLQDPLPALGDLVVAAARFLKPGSRRHARIEASAPGQALS
jgi:predicted ATP-grasp superfamily ATP-dependent carboligase